jgi:hypothetical protein
MDSKNIETLLSSILGELKKITAAVGSHPSYITEADIKVCEETGKDIKE